MRTAGAALAASWIAASIAACSTTAHDPAPAASPVPAPASVAVLPEPAALADSGTWEAWRRADEVVLAPHRFVASLAPLVERRQAQGHVVALLETEPLYTRFSRGAPDARALQTAVRSLAAHAPETLRYVFLVGDDDELPTFYLRKVPYEHHSKKEHDNPHAISRAEHATYPSDEPYSSRGEGSPGAARLAVGRLPARSPDEVDAFVGKLVAYETRSLADGDQTWRRRVTIFAGDPYLGEMGNNVVKTVAEGILDEDMSYDYDLRLTFAKDDSPYAYGFDRIERKLVSDLDDGALVAAYVGHGAVTRFAPASFRGQDYEVGTADDAASLRIAAGKPIFFSIACDTGAFDRPGGLPSLAERMILNPDGPIAVFASSRESHPYPNALYGQQIIRHFVNEHPATVGEGILAIKDGMVHDSLPVAELLLGDEVDLLKAEHVGLYNLFGDPATRMRYADALSVTVPADAAGVAGGASFTVDVAAPTVAEGTVRVTLETRRRTLKGAIVRPESMSRMSAPDAFAAMAGNNATANDKVVVSQTGDMHAGRARMTLRAPPEAGDYVVKAFASGAEAAAGHATLHVRGP
ncbi:MAG TPA: C25 family cysteine peptidase [Polyangiaceae bacterium]